MRLVNTSKFEQVSFQANFFRPIVRILRKLIREMMGNFSNLGKIVHSNLVAIFYNFLFKVLEFASKNKHDRLKFNKVYIFFVGLRPG